jgi:hypothetical protein
MQRDETTMLHSMALTDTLILVTAVIHIFTRSEVSQGLFMVRAIQIFLSTQKCTKRSIIELFLGIFCQFV